MIVIIEPVKLYTSKIVKGQTYCEQVILRDNRSNVLCLFHIEDINETLDGDTINRLNQGESVTVELTMEAVED